MVYRGTSLRRNTPLLGHFNRTLWSPMVVLEGGSVSYEQGTLVFSVVHWSVTRCRFEDRTERTTLQPKVS